MISNEDAYTGRYYREWQPTVECSASVVVPAVVDLVRPRSVIDVGCGGGAWAAEFVRNGVPDVLGVDGDYVDPSVLALPAGCFLACDLTSSFVDRIGRRFDLVVCLEVAEHLSTEHAERFAASLTELGDTILFSAAIPGQGGTNHVNEQWPSWWSRLFAAAGFEVVDVLRARFWNDERVAVWYRQNVFVYTRRPEVLARASAGSTLPVDAVHPELWTRVCRKRRQRSHQMTAGEILREIPGVIGRSLVHHLRLLARSGRRAMPAPARSTQPRRPRT